MSWNPRVREATACEGVNAAATPGVTCTQLTIDDHVRLAIEKHTHVPVRAAGANDLYAALPERQFAAKEICRWVSAPTGLAMTALKRLRRYLVGNPLLVVRCLFQEPGSIECHSDTDRAGCPRTCKSTSGRV